MLPMSVIVLVSLLSVAIGLVYLFGHVIRLMRPLLVVCSEDDEGFVTGAQPHGQRPN